MTDKSFIPYKDGPTKYRHFWGFYKGEYIQFVFQRSYSEELTADTITGGLDSRNDIVNNIRLGDVTYLTEEEYEYDHD